MDVDGVAISDEVSFAFLGEFKFPWLFLLRVACRCILVNCLAGLDLDAVAHEELVQTPLVILMVFIVFPFGDNLALESLERRLALNHLRIVVLLVAVGPAPLLHYRGIV